MDWAVWGGLGLWFATQGVLEEGVQNCDETVSKSMEKGSEKDVLHFREHFGYTISLICQREGTKF